MIVVPVKEGENIEKALKKFKRKFEKTLCCKSQENNARHLRAENAASRGLIIR